MTNAFLPSLVFAGADWPAEYPEGQCGGQEQSPINLSPKEAEFNQFDIDIQQAESGVEGHIKNVGGECACGLLSCFKNKRMREHARWYAQCVRWSNIAVMFKCLYARWYAPCSSACCT